MPELYPNPPHCDTCNCEPSDVWLRLLAEAGFEPSAVTEETTEDRTRVWFIGRRPPE